jgi:DNA-binding MarR family transcriptional regulator
MPDDRLHRLLREAFLYLYAGDNQALTPFELDVTEYEALKFLSTERGRSIGELREHLLIDKSRATRLIDALEAKGLVRRMPNPSDRRSPNILLTAPGMAARVRAGEAFQDSLRRRFDKLSAAEQSQLGTLLDKLIWSLLSEADSAHN